MKRRTIIILSSVAALFLVGLTVLYLNLSSIAEQSVERVGSAVLGVPVEAAGASVSLLGESVTIDGLTLGSPEGFKEEYMLKLQSLHVDLTLSSLFGGQLEIPRVLAEQPDVTLEFDGRKTNWGAVLQNTRSKEEEDVPEPAEKRVQLQLFETEGGSVRVAAFPGSRTVKVSLPNISLPFSESDDKSLTVREVLVRIIAVLRGAVLKGIRDELPQEQLKALPSDLRNLSDDAASAFGE
ncbi:MAG: AsmA family protein, partial [Planctomycetota bacterium]